MKLASGEQVVHRDKLHLHGDVERLLPEVLEKIDAKGRQFIEVAVNLGRIVGETICVVTNPDDEIIFATRPNRRGPTRFVVGRKPENCSTVFVVLKKAVEENAYVLITAFIGYKPEVEPWDSRAAEASRVFWETHALIWGEEQIMCSKCGLAFTPYPRVRSGECHACRPHHQGKKRSWAKPPL